MPRQVDHDEYRTELIRSCTELFAKEGYTALTMRRIAKHIGVSTGTLYHYFPNKEAMFLGVVDDVSKQDLLDVEAAIPPTLGPAERARVVLAYVEAMEPYFLSQNLVLIEYFRTLAPETVRTDPALRRAADFYQQTVAKVLGVERSRAKAILIYLKGLILQRLYDGRDTAFADQAPFIEALLTE